jgi:hypothetical protein
MRTTTSQNTLADFHVGRFNPVRAVRAHHRPEPAPRRGTRLQPDL